MEIRIFDKFDQNTQRGIIKNCQLCNQQFGVFIRQHQCKRCLRAICSDCSTAKRDVYKQKKIKGQHRACKVCAEQSNFIIEFISVNKLQFGKDCELSIKWQKRLSQQQRGIPIKGHQIRSTKKFTKQIFDQLWDSYNFSLRQFIGLLTFTKSQTDIFTQVSRVYEEIQLRGIQEKMQHIIYIIIFVLCFSSVQTCPDLIYFLHSIKQTINDGKQLLSLYLKGLSVTESDIKKLSDYYNFKLKTYLGSLSINTLTTQCSIHLITRLFEKKKIDQAYMLFALALQNNKSFIITNRSNKIQCDIEILRKSKLNNFLDKYRLLVSVKSTPFIKSRKGSSDQTSKMLAGKQKQVSSSGHKSSRDSDNQQMNFVADFRKKRLPSQNEDSQSSWSNKTKSIRQSSDLLQQTTFSPRKTQKYTNSQINTDSHKQKPLTQKKQKSQSLLIPIKTPQKQAKLGNILMPMQSPCQKCQDRLKVIEQLQQKIQKKDRQISRLTTQLSFKSQQVENYFHQNTRSRHDTQQIVLKNQQLTKMQQKLLQKCQENQNNFKMLTKYQKQIMNLKSQIQELNTNNKLLKNRLQSVNFSSNSMSSSSGYARNSQRQEQLARQIQLLKKTLFDKNKQLEELMKKNRLLSFQIDQNEKTNKSKASNNHNQENIFDKARKLQNQNKQLMKKYQQSIDKYNDEQAQCLKINRQLFDLKQFIKDTQQSRLSIMSMPQPASMQKTHQKHQQKSKDDGCNIF